MHPKVIKKFITLLLCLLTGIALTACGGGGSSDSGGGTGTLSTSMTDSAADDYQAVFVTVVRVEVDLDGDEDTDGPWTNVTPDLVPTTFNLMELTNGVREKLGLVDLPTGHYPQIRLILRNNEDGKIAPHPYANYVIGDSGDVHPLTLTSQDKNGLKIVTSFYIIENQTTELLIDFDASRSVVKAGKSGKYLLKPTVKVVNTAEYAIVKGKVEDASSTPLAGTYVTAQVFDVAQAEIDKVVIHAGTLTGELFQGINYQLFLEPESYNLVTTKEDYPPACKSVNLNPGDILTVDFSLAAMADWQPVEVTIEGVPTERYVTIDFRQQVSCTNVDTQIVSQQWVTVKSDNVENDTFEVKLPAGKYKVVASIIGMDPLTAELDVPTTGGLTFTFP